MPYILITEDGRFMEFHLCGVAEMYKNIHGGQVIKTSELLEKSTTKSKSFYLTQTKLDLLIDRY